MLQNENAGSVLDFTLGEQLNLFGEEGLAFKGSLNLRDARRGNAKANRHGLQRFICRAPRNLRKFASERAGHEAGR